MWLSALIKFTRAKRQVAKVEGTGERGYYFMGTELQFLRMAGVLEMAGGDGFTTMWILTTVELHTQIWLWWYYRLNPLPPRSWSPDHQNVVTGLDLEGGPSETPWRLSEAVGLESTSRTDRKGETNYQRQEKGHPYRCKRGHKHILQTVCEHASVNLEKMDPIPTKHKLPEMTQGELGNLNGPTCVRGGELLLIPFEKEVPRPREFHWWVPPDISRTNKTNSTRTPPGNKRGE